MRESISNNSKDKFPIASSIASVGFEGGDQRIL